LTISPVVSATNVISSAGAPWERDGEGVNVRVGVILGVLVIEGVLDGVGVGEGSGAVSGLNAIVYPSLPSFSVRSIAPGLIVPVEDSNL